MKELDILYSTHPAKFYMCSAPAHKSFHPVFIPIAKANKVHLGDQEHINARTINQFIHSKYNAFYLTLICNYRNFIIFNTHYIISLL